MAAVVIEVGAKHVRLGSAADGPRGVEVLRRRRVARAIEAYREACAAEGTPPTEAEGWLVLLAALHCPD